MRTIIYYFTGTGNTKMVCDKYKEEFEKKDIECVLFPMNEFKNIPDPNEFDLIGFAYPIHGFNAPYIVYDFIRKLPDVKGHDFFIVKTSGEPIKLNNASSLHLKSKLRKKHFGDLTNEYHYVMPYNMIFRHTDEQAAHMWKVAQQLVPIDVNDILEGKTNKLKTPMFGSLVSFVCRIEHPAMKINGKFFKVNEKKCIHCMKCVKDCPVHNISFVDGKFKFENRCIMCTRCSFNCPKDAIKIGILNGWRVNGRYNFKNPDLTQVCKKPNYCKKAYNEYYIISDKKIKINNINLD